MRSAEPTPSTRSVTDTASTGPSERHTGRRLLVCLALGIVCATPSGAFAQVREVMVRIAEIEVEAGSVETYKAILEKEAEASVRLEPGVIAIFPVYDGQRPTNFKILEVYASRHAYESHLHTPHFERYKTSTSKMVRSLTLVDVKPIDVATMSLIFAKMKPAR